MKKPNPGSDEALKQGCKCAVIDNHHGEGFVVDGERCWWQSSNCPLHGFEIKIDGSDLEMPQQ